MLRVGRVNEIIEQLDLIDSVICFGAGKRIETLKAVFNKTRVLEKIKYFVDNDTNKHGTKICVMDREIEVISFSEFKRKKLNNCIILIIPKKYREILRQINEDVDTKDIICYCMTHQIALMEEDLAMNKRIPLSLKRSNDELIPKIIHYCWFGKKPLPDKYKKWMESWYRYCPDYKVIEWNESNYDVTKNEYMKQAYEKKKWGFVSDVARLDIIYNCGGIYLDTDVELVDNMDDLLYQKGFAGFESNAYVGSGLGFGAIKRLPIIKDMLDFYEKIDFFNNNGWNMVPCPVWQTKILKEKGLVANGEYQIVDDLTILPEKVLSGKSFSTRRIRLAPYTKAIHHYEGSWLDEEMRKEFWNLEEEMNGRNGYSIYSDI